MAKGQEERSSGGGGRKGGKYSKRGKSGGEKSTLAQEVHFSALQLSQAKVAPGQRGSERRPGGGALRLRPGWRSQNNLPLPNRLHRRLSLLFIKACAVLPFVFFPPPNCL